MPASRNPRGGFNIPLAKRFSKTQPQAKKKSEIGFPYQWNLMSHPQAKRIPNFKKITPITSHPYDIAHYVTI